MTPIERRDASLEFAQRSDREFDHDGNTMIAAELLWGAVAHALIAIAEINEWPCQGHKGHKGYFQVAARLAEGQPGISWQCDIAAADQLHGHFYNSDLIASELNSRRLAARRALHKAIALLPTD